MSVPQVIKHTGVAVSTSTATSSPLSGGPFDTSFTFTANAQKQGQLDLLNVLISAPMAVPLENITKVRVFIATVSGTSVVLLLTSAAGSQKAVPLAAGGLHAMFLPVLGTELTAIEIYGDGATVSYFIAGDHA